MINVFFCIELSVYHGEDHFTVFRNWEFIIVEISVKFADMHKFNLHSWLSNLFSDGSRKKKEINVIAHLLHIASIHNFRDLCYHLYSSVQNVT
jgi:hypothetical protein